MNAYLRSLSKNLLIAGTLAAMTLAATSSFAQDQPPGAGRLLHLQGNVSIQPNGLNDWGQATINQPVGAGDRVYTDQQSRGELEVGPVRAYFSAGSDLTLVNYDENGIQLGLGQGTVAIYTNGMPPGQQLSIQTPNGSVNISEHAGFRVDVYLDQQSTVVTNYRNCCRLNLYGAGDFSAVLDPDQSIQLSGSNPVYAQPLQPNEPDEFGHWSSALATHFGNSPSLRYLSPDMPAYDELDNNGDWQPDSPYGPVWFPRVQAGWAPYHNGHWVNRPYYGWTWVADEPWGIAPFHYGRWAVIEGRWGWIPGPRDVHPIWSPAQVVFAGGISIGGIGVSAWFPLGPGEAYHPWYPATPEYVNRINITNIRETNTVHIQNNYTVINNVTNVTYVNRTNGVTAMKQQDFAAGHAAQTVAVKVAPAQIEHIQPSRPEAPAPAQPVILHPVAKPVAAPVARPVLINSKGQQAPAAPNARPVPVQVKAAPPASAPLPGRTPVGTPSVGNKPVLQPTRPVAPAPVAPAAPVRPMTPAPMPGKPAPTPVPVPAKPTMEPVHPMPAPTKPMPPEPRAPIPAAPAPAAPARPVPPPAKVPAEPARPIPPPAKAPVEPIKPQPMPAKPLPPPQARPLPPEPPQKAVPLTKDEKKDQKQKEKEEKKEDKKPE